MNRIIPLVLAVALFMEQMDSSIISTSLPAIAVDIGTSPIALKLAFTAYLVSLAVFIPISGWMADRFGAKNVFRAAIAVFVVGSIACAVSNSLLAFVASRFLQGVGGAMMTPVGRLVLVRSTPRHELVSAMAYLTIPALVGPLIGAPVGGFITTYLTWHWIFIINVPIGILGIWFATRVLPDDTERSLRPLDWPGFILSGLGMSAIIFGLSVVSMPYISPVIGLTTIATGIVASILYVWHAKKTPHPLLDLSLFKNRTFNTAVVGGGIFRLGVGAMPFLLPMMFQIGFGLNPFQSGMITFIIAVGAMSMKFGVNRIFARFGFRHILIIGSLVSAGLMAINGLFTPSTPYLLIMPLLLLSGLVRSLFFTGVNALAFAEIPDAQTSQATPITAVAQQISIALGVALAGVVLEVSTTIHGGPLRLEDFHIAFFVVAFASALSFFLFVRLSPNAGHELHTRIEKKPTEDGAPPITGE
ncbi:DHA2 family efflux MFS transporter permease subunit [Phyllobacterium leguminum]|uniref:EmrB/QacA subfamily drug resistance transporter n=1 Tax=Phyllobacterium leguminum TaxID=314237 RepID=A0A318T9W0_9HYPH|nr:DHA2 family efflux MFS transporter permease subunit [Phyllobacterium leguminum]PYE90454.1 EmrB/QacA subfamily drug resistance transporter [Phyllobacterium leguminum]